MTKRPKILLIVSGQQRYDAVSGVEGQGRSRGSPWKKLELAFRLRSAKIFAIRFI
jgi:hypothetical protein